MGTYCVRYKGAKIKGARVPKSNTPFEDEEGGEEEEEAQVAEMAGSKKMKISTPEKAVVAAVLGIAPKPKAKKKEFPTRAIIGTKGSAKSGNYGHRGIPGKVGGSAPKGGAVTGTGGAKFETDRAAADRLAQRPGEPIARVMRSMAEESGKPAGMAKVDYSRTDSWLKDFPDREHLRGSMYAYNELKSVFPKAHATTPGGDKVKVVIPGASLDGVRARLSMSGFRAYGKSPGREVMNREVDKTAAVIHTGGKTGVNVDIMPYED